jgi:6-phosphogluconolactonase (cycloisomerase 2 family)
MSPVNCQHLASSKHAALAALLIISGTLVGCGDALDSAGDTISSGAGGTGTIGGNGGGSTTASSVLISGTITGLQGSDLVLQTNGVYVPISGNIFSIYLSAGSPYNIVPTVQPKTPTQDCTVSNGSGTATANVSNVTVSCVTQSFTLSGTISGLLGAGLILQDEGNAVPVSGNAFSLSLASGSAYDIVAAQQPTNPGQTCTVTNGGPGVIGGANVIVGIACVTNTYTVSVIVNGLQNGATGLKVLDNGGDSLPVTGNGTFTFATALASGQPYAVNVGTQPTGTSLAQYCIVPNGTGTVTAANISVTLTCRNVGQALFAASIWDTRDGSLGDIVGYTINPANGNLTSAVGSPYAADNQPFAISLDTQNQILYAINNQSNDISTFSVSPTTGVLTGLHTAPGYPTSGAGIGGLSVLVDPQAPNFVFAGSDAAPPDGLVDSFTASAGGVLSAPTPTAAGNDPVYMTINPTGTLLFAPELFENDIFVYRISVAGALSQVAGSPFPNTPAGGAASGPAAVAVSPTARNLYVAGLFNATVTAYAYDDSGTLTALAPPYTFGTGTGAGGFLPGDGLAIDPTGRFLYVTSPVDNTVTEYAISAQTGLLTLVGTPVATGDGPSDAKIDPSGHYLYVSNYSDGTISEYAIDPGTGELTEGPNSPFEAGFGTQSIAIE